VSERLPALMDCKAVMAEMGVTRSVAESVMRRLPLVEFPGIRKAFVTRADLAAFVEACTRREGRVPS
jgi:hypothetical protein